MALLSLELCTVREETEHLRTVVEVREPSEQLQSAIRDRDEAIAKYGYCPEAKMGSRMNPVL